MLYLLIISTLLRLILAAFVPPLGDETYHWHLGTQFLLSYDHPPLTYWLAAIGDGNHRHCISRDFDETDDLTYARQFFTGIVPQATLTVGTKAHQTRLRLNLLENMCRP
jgi:hypothetical protein